MASVTAEGLAVSGAINIAVCFVLFCVFNFLRVWSVTRKFFASRRYYTIPNLKKPSRLPNSWLGWFRPLFQYTEVEMMDIAGIDALMYLKIIQFGLELFAFVLVWNWITVLPMNAIGFVVDRKLAVQDAKDIDPSDEDAASANQVYTTLDKASMSNVQAEDQVLWIHFVSCFVTSFFIYRLLWKYQKDAVALRIKYLSKQPRGAQSHTIFTTDIPGTLSGTALHRVYGFVQSTLYKVLPQFVEKKLEAAIEAAGSMVSGATGTENAIQLSKLKDIESRQGFVGMDKLMDERPVDAKSVGSDDEFHDATRAHSFSSAKSDFVGGTAPIDPSSEPTQTTRAIAQAADTDPWETAAAKLAAGKEVRDVVIEEFQEVYPNKLLQSVYMVRSTATLEKLVNRYEATMQDLQDTVDTYTATIRRRVPIKKRATVKIIPMMLGEQAKEKYGVKPVNVDKLEYLPEKLRSMQEEIKELQNSAWNNPTASAFITFKTRFAQTIGASSLHHHDLSTWNTTFAPAPMEIVWSNLPWRSWERTLRSVVIWTFFFAMCIFFSIPVIALQGLLDSATNSEWFKNNIMKYSFLEGILSGILPQLALMLFLILVPIILRFCQLFQGCYSESQIDFGVVRKYFIFQVVVVFLMQTLSGSLFDQFKEIINNPQTLIDVLGSSVPKQASFFVNYVLLQGVVAEPTQMLRLFELVVFILLSKFAATERRKARLWMDQKIVYGKRVVPHTIAILLGLVFSTLQPVMALVALLYFLVNTVVWRYQLLYIFTEQYKSGGQMWPIIFDQVLVAVYIQQLMMIGFLTVVKKFYYAPILFALPIITVAFQITAKRMFNRPMQVLSLRAAHDLDEIDRLRPQTEDQVKDSKVQYLHPAFKVDFSKLDQLLNEVNVVEKRMRGEQVSQAELEAAEYNEFQDIIDDEDEDKSPVAGSESQKSKQESAAALEKPQTSASDQV